MAPKNGPPDRWMDYSPMGNRIHGTRFICMKVPLKPGLSRNMEENEKFTCENAIEIATAKGHKLGLVIDLSFTKRYYDPEMFEKLNVAHEKIFMPGHVLPQKTLIKSFTDVVTKFEDENEVNDDLIAVHCTHGLNRTGYMICRYLIDKKEFKPEDAINAFEEARGYKIEREIYLNDLLGKPNSASPKKYEKRVSRHGNHDNFTNHSHGYSGGHSGLYSGFQDSRTLGWEVDPYGYNLTTKSEFETRQNPGPRMSAGAADPNGPRTVDHRPDPYWYNASRKGKRGYQDPRMEHQVDPNSYRVMREGETGGRGSHDLHNGYSYQYGPYYHHGSSALQEYQTSSINDYPGYNFSDPYRYDINSQFPHQRDGSSYPEHNHNQYYWSPNRGGSEGYGYPSGGASHSQLFSHSQSSGPRRARNNYH